MFYLSKTSKKKLKGVHPDLVAVVERAIELTLLDFKVGEGMRTEERQKELVAKGKSTTMRSRHLTGHAVDLWALRGNKVVWDWDAYYEIRDAMVQAAEELGVNVEWGGDWKSFRDGPHFQLSWAEYPA